MSLGESSFQHEPVKVDPPRELTQWEHEVLAKMLSPDFEGAEALRQQLQHTRVWEECARRPGCPVVQLTVDRTRVAPAQPRQTPMSVEAQTILAETLLDFKIFVDGDGFLSLLDVIPIGDEWPIKQLPDPEELEVFPGGAPDRWFFPLPERYLTTLSKGGLRDLIRRMEQAMKSAKLESELRHLEGQLDAVRSELQRRH
jgi:hypothetical protein